SRCQRHNFRRIPAARMLERLAQIARAEKADLSEGALSLIVRQAEGGMRDALSLLDQVLSACGAGASDEAVAEALGAIDRTVVQAFAEALVHRDPAALLRLVEDSHDKGVDLRRLTEEVALQLRHVLVTLATGAAPAELADAEQQAVAKLAREADAAQLARLFDVVHGAVWDVGRAAQPRLALEMSLLKAVQLAPAASIPELIARVEKLAGAAGPEPARKPAGAPGGRSQPAPFRA
ncbi:MAG TPA: DNA polymerase III subunit gamma/tau, partial [Myxococcaceae bacterium]|nr:DNA polymerase III subunit gamma/tau [Myxococcaceae bacterium]